MSDTNRASSWFLSMVLINLLFAEMYFLASGAAWKFYLSLAMSALCFLGFIRANRSMRNIR